jgi:malic enzyme
VPVYLLDTLLPENSVCDWTLSDNLYGGDNYYRLCQEAILGIGDQGVGGMGIPIGKLALYTAGAGIHPSHCLPIDLDVGTDNQSLLDDPLYLGVPQRRLRGPEYDSLVDELVDAVREVFPRSLIQWEDFASRNAFRVLERHRDRVLSFNDDIEGTGAVLMAGIRSALQHVGRSLRDERVVFLGAGASGAGCAIAVRRAMREAGIPESELASRVLSLDSRGLIVRGRPGLEGEKAAIAADPALVNGWPAGPGGGIPLAEVVGRFHPTILIGASGQPGWFTESMIRDMARHCERPIVMPISNPTSRIEATPEQILTWTEGRAVVGTGSPFEPVAYGGVTHVIGQGNNAMIFPGVGLGAIAVEARCLTDGAFTAAERAVVSCTSITGTPGEPIYPPLSRLREVSFRVAVAVATQLIVDGATPVVRAGEVERRVRDLVWEPTYRPYRAA